MLDIRFGESGEIIISGRFDAAQEEKAKAFMSAVTGRRTVDFRGLEYISSAGLGLLLSVQKRLLESGGGLKLINMSRHIRDVFHYSGFDRVFEIHEAASD